MKIEHKYTTPTERGTIISEVSSFFGMRPQQTTNSAEWPGTRLEIDGDAVTMLTKEPMVYEIMGSVLMPRSFK